MRTKPTEEKLQLQVINWLKYQHPGIIAISDLSGVKMTGRQANTAKNLKTHTKVPDMTIYASRLGFNALLIELKRDEYELITKGNARKNEDLGLWKSEHVKGQYDMICALQDEGFAACFCTSFEDATKLITTYLRESNTFVSLYNAKLADYERYDTGN